MVEVEMGIPNLPTLSSPISETLEFEEHNFKTSHLKECFSNTFCHEAQNHTSSSLYTTRTHTPERKLSRQLHIL